MASLEPKEAFFSRAALSSLIWILSGKLATLSIYLAISIVLVRELSPAAWGAYSLTLSLAEYLAIPCGLGLNYALLRYLPELLARGSSSGLKRLLKKSALLQLLAVSAAALLLYLLQERIEQLFQIRLYWAAASLLTAALLAKEYFNNAFTALYLSKKISLLSIAQGLLFLGGLAAASSLGLLSSRSALWIYALSILFLLPFSGFGFSRALPPEARGSGAAGVGKSGVGKRRLARLALPYVATMLANKLLEQYSEIFFLGYFASPSIVGQYALGINLAQMAISFIPLSLNSLFVSAFSEVFSESRESLSKLMRALYQLLILVCLPIACYGAAASPRLVPWIYGEAMAPAGLVASFFFAFKLLPLLWIPLSIAITTREKKTETLWLDLLPLFVNLLFDYLLIPSYGLLGACLAVALAFFSILPLKLWFIRRAVGTISFPLLFFAKLAAASLCLALLFSLLSLPLPPWSLLLVAPAYFFSFLLSIRLLRLVGPADLEPFSSAGLPSLALFVKFLVGS